MVQPSATMVTTALLLAFSLNIGGVLIEHLVLFFYGHVGQELIGILHVWGCVKCWS
jgi:hypothetical protein